MQVNVPITIAADHFWLAAFFAIPNKSRMAFNAVPNAEEVGMYIVNVGFWLFTGRTFHCSGKSSTVSGDFAISSCVAKMRIFVSSLNGARACIFLFFGSIQLHAPAK